MSIKTVKVINVSLGAAKRDILEFFTFCGDIAYVELRSHDEGSQTAYVTFKDTHGAETAVLLSEVLLPEKQRFDSSHSTMVQIDSMSLLTYAMRLGKIMSLDVDTKRTGVAFHDPRLITQPLPRIYEYNF
ncbi:RNA recognition motif [Medicago truncatula]|uniref:RNA recognition motif n=1 Tax=Medicago truncatula TaxID=3880 RepID=A0A072UED5_MEDTR|nr:RNA recognition motif [Medicago truncatula]